MHKIIKFIKKLKYLDEKYEISIVSAQTSFYIIVASFSFITLGLQIYYYFFQGANNYFINKIYDIINPIYYDTFNKLNPIFSLNHFSFILLINLLWSSSKTINGINRAADLIYKDVKKRKGIFIRITSFLMFLMLFSILLFELVIFVFASDFLQNKIHNFYIYQIIEAIILFFLIYILMILLDMYCPPVIMKIKDAYKGAFIQTTLLSLTLFFFLSIINLYQYINPNYQILSIISLLFIWIYIIIYIIVFGILFNYILNKKQELSN